MSVSYTNHSIQSNNIQTTDGAEHLVEVGFVYEDSLFADEVTVVAKSTDNIHAMWKLQAAFSREGDNAPGIVGSILSLIGAQKDLGALLWTAALELDEGGSVMARVKGASGKTVEWNITNVQDGIQFV